MAQSPDATLWNLLVARDLVKLRHVSRRHEQLADHMLELIENVVVPVKYVFRKMRPDLDDLLADKESDLCARSLDPGDDKEKANDIRDVVFRAISEGSSTRTPFLHAALLWASYH